MDKDVTGFSGLLGAWIPQRIEENLVPIVNRSEETVSNLKAQIARNLLDRIVKSQISSTSLQNEVMNKIDQRIIPIEGKIDSLHRGILEKIDLNLLPQEAITQSKAGLIIPVGFMEPPGVTPILTCPPGMMPVGPGIPVPVKGNIPGKPGIIINEPQPAPGGCVPIIGSIGNEPICPPQLPCDPCLPCEPCPPPQECNYVDVFHRHCKETDEKCFYAVPLGYGPLSPNDSIVQSDVPCDVHLLNIWAQEKYICPEIPPCEITPLPLGPCCPPPPPCPKPQQIVNIQIPPGGMIINEPNPLFPLQNDPNPPVYFPPYTQPIGGGSIVNIAMLDLANRQGQQDCKPTCDMMFYTLECEDGTRMENASIKMFGTLPSQLLENKNAFDWWKDKIKDLTAWTDDTIIDEPDQYSTGGGH